MSATGPDRRRPAAAGRIETPAWSRRSTLLQMPTPLGPLPSTPDSVFGSSTGAGIRVAIIDTGIEADHPALDRSIDREGGVAFSVDDRTDQVVRVDGPHDDVYGHGTACAGIIHALAPDATITSVRVLDHELRGRAAAFLAGLTWAVDAGFDVINLSLGASPRKWALAFHEVCDRGYFANSFIVTAANNVPRDSFPSLFASVTSVAANRSSDPLRYHANPDPPTEFLARGIDVEVPWRGRSTIVTTGNSFAAPHIAAFAALIKANHPQLRPFHVKAALWASAANVREAMTIDRASRLPSRSSWTAAAAPPRPTPSTASPEPGRSPSPPSSPPPSAAVAAEPSPRDGGATDTTSSRPDHAQPGPLARWLGDGTADQTVVATPWGPIHRGQRDGRPIRIRLIDTTTIANEGLRNRLVAGLRRMAQLDHRHLTPLIDLVVEAGTVVIVTPDHPGAVERFRASGPTLAGALAITVSALEGLDAAHRAGVLHGDLRPASVVVDPGGVVQVTDVGVAAAATSHVRSNATVEGRAWDHVAPEHLRGGAIGPFTDVHGAGVLLFELLSGHLPYPSAPSLGRAIELRTERPRSLAELCPTAPTDLVAVADQAVDPDPTVRPPTARALAQALAEVARRELGPDWSGGALH